jgi:hypothetical protein
MFNTIHNHICIVPKKFDAYKTRDLRIAEIRKNLIDMDKKILENRQKNIDERPARGFDRGMVILA